MNRPLARNNPLLELTPSQCVTDLHSVLRMIKVGGTPKTGVRQDTPTHVNKISRSRKRAKSAAKRCRRRIRNETQSNAAKKADAVDCFVRERKIKELGRHDSQRYTCRGTAPGAIQLFQAKPYDTVPTTHLQLRNKTPSSWPNTTNPTIPSTESRLRTHPFSAPVHRVHLIGAAALG